MFGWCHVKSLYLDSISILHQLCPANGILFQLKYSVCVLFVCADTMHVCVSWPTFVGVRGQFCELPFSVSK